MRPELKTIASRNNLLMQFQADILGVTAVRPKIVETTALGAALFAGLATGIWKNVEDLQAHWQLERSFSPKMSATDAAAAVENWRRAVAKSCQ